MKTLRSFAPHVLSFVVVTGILFGLNEVSHAEDAQSRYTLLESVAGFQAKSPAPDFATYLRSIFGYLIRAAGIIAVVMLVIAGVEYTASGVSEARKGDARKRIENVVIGLIGTISAYFLLSIINPKLVTFSLDIPPIANNTPATIQRQVESESASRASANVVAGEGAAGATGIRPPGLTTPQTQAIAGTIDRRNQQVTADFLAINEQVRQDLTSHIGIEMRPDATTPCQPGQTNKCFTLAGLPSNAILGVKKLQEACNCTLQINGAAEIEGHVEHGPGKPVMDLQAGERLNQYVRDNGTFLRFSGGTGRYKIFRTPLGNFQDERSCRSPNDQLTVNTNCTSGHWHITFN